MVCGERRKNGTGSERYDMYVIPDPGMIRIRELY
jgi:hypothetical protein